MSRKIVLSFIMQLSAILAISGSLPPARAAEKSRYDFCAQGSCTDGVYPQAGVIRDEEGNLYGTTYNGGDEGCRNGSGCGVVFRLSKTGTESVLHAFVGGSDGALPTAGLIRDKNGNLYGTTFGGGTQGCGVVFEVASGGSETILYTFNGGTDGCNPAAQLFEDESGNFYGTTGYGGGTGCSPNDGCGAVFKLAPDGTETLLHVFAGGSTDGAVPLAGLIPDEKGNFYGTTAEGGGTGCNDEGCGTVFKLEPNGTETVLHFFGGANDGLQPLAGLIRDKKGNLYGTTFEQLGTVFKLAPDGTETVLYSFKGENDGAMPYGGLVEDTAGNFYGTTKIGGGGGCDGGEGCGTVFELTRNGSESLLYSFGTGSNGAYPLGTLILAGKKRLIGSTSSGGAGSGVIFELNK